MARVNYFGAMAGVPASVRFDPNFSEMGQDAALIMSANQKLGHSPRKTWSCWSQPGFDGAANSNLSLGSMGWDAIASQMIDNGVNNSPVGHRRWILFPQTQEMGTGDIPKTSSYRAANALWWNDSRHFEPRPPTRDGFVARPPPGNVPYQIVPTRWSLSYPEADFNAATVQMTRGGVPVAVVLESLEPPPGANWFIGEDTLVWVPEGSPGRKAWTGMAKVTSATSTTTMAVSRTIRRPPWAPSAPNRIVAATDC